MNTLDEAWKWYEDTKACLSLFRRLGDRHRDNLPWDGGLGRDDAYRDIQGEDIVVTTGNAPGYLDDLAVLVLFSVFESVVRDRVLSEIQNERNKLTHAQIIRIIDEALDGIKTGSFYRVMEAFKSQDAGLVEEVNQVRRYRNWVAHGRRAEPPEMVEPRIAHERLKRFLDQLPTPT